MYRDTSSVDCAPRELTLTLLPTYKSVIKRALEYASSILSPLASSTSIHKLQVMKNVALRTATECRQDTNIQYMHDETLILPIHKHLQLHASHYKQKTPTVFNNGRYTSNIPIDPTQLLQQTYKQAIHTYYRILL